MDDIDLTTLNANNISEINTYTPNRKTDIVEYIDTRGVNNAHSEGLSENSKTIGKNENDAIEPQNFSNEEDKATSYDLWQRANELEEQSKRFALKNENMQKARALLGRGVWGDSYYSPFLLSQKVKYGNIENIDTEAREILKNIVDSEGDPKQEEKVLQYASILADAYDISISDAYKKAIEWTEYLTSRNLKDKDVGTLAFNEVKTWYHQKLNGFNEAMYMITGDKQFQDYADFHHENIMKNRRWQHEGNILLCAINPIMEVGTQLLLALGTQGLGNALGVTAKGLSVGSNIAIGISAGLESAGANAYELSLYKDDNGDRYNPRNRTGVAIFLLDALIEGTIEVANNPAEKIASSLFVTKTEKQIAKKIAKESIEKASKQLSKQMFKKSVGEFFKGYVGNLVGESFEEFLQQFSGNVAHNMIAQIYGDNYDMQKKSLKEMGLESVDAFVQTFKGQLIAGLITPGTVNMIRRAKGYTNSVKTGTVDIESGFVNADPYRNDISKEEIEQRVNERKDKSGKVEFETARLTKFNDRFLPVPSTRNDALEILAAESVGKETYNVEFTNNETIDIANKRAFVDSIKGFNVLEKDEALVFKNEKQRNNVIRILQRQFGKQNVRFNESDNSITIKSFGKTEGTSKNKTAEIKLETLIDNNFYNANSKKNDLDKFLDRAEKNKEKIKSEENVVDKVIEQYSENEQKANEQQIASESTANDKVNEGSSQGILDNSTTTDRQKQNGLNKAVYDAVVEQAKSKGIDFEFLNTEEIKKFLKGRKNTDTSKYSQIRDDEANKKFLQSSETIKKNFQKFLNSKPLDITNYESHIELSITELEKLLAKKIQGVYLNNDTKRNIIVDKKHSVKELKHQGISKAIYRKSLFALNKIIESMQYIATSKNDKNNNKFDRYDYFLTKIIDNGNEYLLKSTIGLKGNRYYYSQAIFEQEKISGRLARPSINRGGKDLSTTTDNYVVVNKENITSLYKQGDISLQFYDKRLNDILQIVYGKEDLHYSVSNDTDSKLKTALNTSGDIIKLASNNAEATEHLKALKGKVLISADGKASVVINSVQREKLVSNVAILKSANNGFTREEHLRVVANVDRIFTNAVKNNYRSEEKHKQEDANVNVERYETPILLRAENDNFQAMVTIKISTETKKNRKDIKGRIYSVELEIKKNESGVEGLNGEHKPNSATHSYATPPVNLIIAQNQKNVNDKVEDNLQYSVDSDNKEYEAVVRKYRNTDKWLKAPNDNDTKLTERQWIQVRTPSFKKWFGDWELKAKLDNLLQSEIIDVSNNSTTDENAKEIYKQIGKVVNNDSGDNVNFIKGSFGKIERHNNYDPRIIGSLKLLFENSILIDRVEPDFDTPRKDGTIHKKQNNIESFSYYLNKIKIDNNEYLIRFTVQDLKHKAYKNQEHNFHSQQLTEIDINKLSTSAKDTTLALWSDAVGASDYKLAQILDNVKNNTSKVVDENGEPLVVYHGTDEEFTRFDVTKIKPYHSEYGIGFYFAESKEKAKSYGNNVYECFLNAKYGLKEKTEAYKNGTIDKSKKKDYLYVEDKGYYVVYNPNQIKSATDNIGAFSSGNDDIRFAFKEGQINGFTYKDNGKVKVVINTDKITDYSTPMHEYTHIWAEIIREADKEGWNEIKKTVSSLGEESIKSIIGNKDYYDSLKSKGEDSVVDEVIAILTGKEGNKRIEETIKALESEGKKIEAKSVFAQIKMLLRKFIDSICEVLGINSKKFDSIEKIQNAVLADLFFATNITNVDIAQESREDFDILNYGSELFERAKLEERIITKGNEQNHWDIANNKNDVYGFFLGRKYDTSDLEQIKKTTPKREGFSTFLLLDDNDRVVQIEMLENALVDKKDAGAIRKELLNRSLSTNGTGAVKVVAIIQNPQTFYDMFEQTQDVVDDYQKAQAGQREKYYTLENGRAKKHFRTVSKSYPYQFIGLLYQGDISDVDSVEGSDYIKETIKENPYTFANGLNTNLLSRTRLKNEFLKKYADYNSPEYKGKRAELTAVDKKYFALAKQYVDNRQRTADELEKLGIKDAKNNYTDESLNENKPLNNYYLQDNNDSEYDIFASGLPFSVDRDSFSESIDRLQKLFETGEDFTITNPQVGEIVVKLGETGKSGYGIKHIIEQRHIKDGLNADEIAKLLPLIIETAKSGNAIRENQKIIELQNNKTRAIIAKEFLGKNERWILTGFDLQDRTKENTDDVNTVIANNNYALNNSYFRNQVGAIISSINSISDKTDEIKFSLDRNKQLPFIQSFAEDDSIVELSEKEKAKLLKVVKRKGYVLSYDTADFYNDKETLEAYDSIMRLKLSGLDIVELARKARAEQAETETRANLTEQKNKELDRESVDVKATLINAIKEHLNSDTLDNNEMNAVDMAIKIAPLTRGKEQVRIFREKIKDARAFVEFMGKLDKWIIRVAKNFNVDMERLDIDRYNLESVVEARDYITENIEMFSAIDKAIMDNPQDPNIEGAIYYSKEAEKILDDLELDIAEETTESENEDEEEEETLNLKFKKPKLENIGFLALTQAEILKEQKKLGRALKQNEVLKLKMAKENSLRVLKKLIKPSKSHDVFEEPLLLWVQTKYFTQNSDTYMARVERLNKLGFDIDTTPEMLEDVFNQNEFDYTKNEELELEDLKALTKSLRELRHTARVSYEQKQIERRNLLWGLKQDMFNELRVDGEKIDINPNIEEERKQLNLEIEGYTARLDVAQKDKDRLEQALESIKDQISKVEHPWVIAQKIDGGNGVLSQMIKAQRALTSREQGMITKRKNKFNTQLKELGLNEKTLPDWLIGGKENKEYPIDVITDNGVKNEYLNRNEAITLYNYYLNPTANKKLTSPIGNRFTKESVDNVIGKIGDKEKAFAKLMRESLAERFEDIKNLTYSEYNELVTTEDNYFPLVGSRGSIGGVALKVDEEFLGDKADTINLNARADTRFADRSMTKERSSAVYALDLNGWSTFNRAIANQEHFIHFAHWVRNAQYILSNKGVGHIIPFRVGSATYQVLKSYVNDVAQPNNTYIQGGVLDKIFGNIAISKLLLNPLTAIKQLGAFGGVFMDENTTVKSLLKTISDLSVTNIKKRGATIETIKEASGLINTTQSNLGLAFERMRTDNIANKWDIRKQKWQEFGLSLMEKADMEARLFVWWNSYNAGFNKGLSEREAIYRADEIVSKTQNSSFVGDLSYFEKNAKSLISRAALVFSNQKFKYLNAMLGTGKNAKRIGGVIGMLGVSALINLLVSGLLFKRPDEEEKDKEKRVKKAILTFVGEMSFGQIPIIGDSINDMLVNNFTGGGDLITGTLVSPVVNVIKRFEKLSEGKATTADIIESVFDLGVGAIEMLFGAPSVEINRAKKFYNKEEGRFDIVGGLVSMILGGGIYKSFR